MQLKNLDLNKLHTFLAVVEQGGVAQAGSALGRTASAVSQAVSGLEAALGQKLFDRVGKRLVLTRGGQILHERVAAYQVLLGRTVNEVANESGQVRGLVRIGLFLGFPRTRFADFVTGFTRRYPAVGIRVTYASQEDLGHRLVRNRLDFAFSFRSAPSAGALLATRLFERELVLVASRRFFARGFDQAELERTPVIDYYQGDPLIARWLTHHLRGRAPAIDVRVWAATTDLALDLILEHAGVGVLPHDLVAPHVERGRLRVLRPSRRRLVEHLWLLEPRGAYRDTTLATFREAVLEEFSG